MNRLQDRVCLVTGAAQGIGKGIARRLVEEGGKVWIVDLNGAGVEQTVAELSAIGMIAGGRCDVSKRDQFAATIAEVVKTWGRLDVLVNNVGIAHVTPFLEIDDRSWDTIMNVNLRSVFHGMQLAATQMIAQGGGGAIVNIGSTNGLRGQPMLADYGASKAAIINLSQTAALELGVHGIRVNALCPGTVVAEELSKEAWESETWTQLRDHTALDTLGRPEDIAAAAAYLASDDARFVTGSVMVVDGGLTARQLTIKPESMKRRSLEG
jgi:3-oxoacyl-[acyl-carrier protein] reductase